MAITFWDLLLPYAPSYKSDKSKAAAGTHVFTPKQYELWKRFLTEASNLRIITKDTWMQFLDFTNEIDADFATHDFDAAWPSVIDDFVEWARKQ